MAEHLEAVREAQQERTDARPEIMDQLSGPIQDLLEAWRTISGGERKIWNVVLHGDGRAVRVTAEEQNGRPVLTVTLLHGSLGDAERSADDLLEAEIMEGLQRMDRQLDRLHAQADELLAASA